MRRYLTRQSEAGDHQRVAPVQTRDPGTTLTELLVTIVIMGIVIAPVMNAVIGVVKASATNRGLAQVETVLTNAADQVNRAPRGCDYTLFAQTAPSPLGWSLSSVTVQQYHYVPGPVPTVTGTWDNGACAGVGGVPDDLEVQLVSITVRNPDTGAQRTIQVVKSRD